MKRATIAAFLCAFAFVPAASFAATSFTEDFTNTTTAGCQADGSQFGSWEVRYASYGCVKVEGFGADRAMVIAPMVSTSAGETHAPLVLGPTISGDVDFTVRMKTDSQLRKNSTPNPWEVGWVLWDYTDDTHFYSLVLKPNGWELGKEDPAYPGAQRFLTTGSSPTFPIGQWNTIRITRSGNNLKAYVNGALLTSFTDNERPYSGGRIGLYNEDAVTRFDDITIGSVTAVVPQATVTTNSAPVVAASVSSAPAQTLSTRMAAPRGRYARYRVYYRGQ